MKTTCPGSPVQLMAGFPRRRNGSAIFCNYRGDGRLGHYRIFLRSRAKNGPLDRSPIT